MHLNVKKNEDRAVRTYAKIITALIVAILVGVLIGYGLFARPMPCRAVKDPGVPKLRVDIIDVETRRQMIQDPRSGCVWLTTKENVYRLKGDANCAVTPQ